MATFIHSSNSQRGPISGLALLVILLSAVNIYYFHVSWTPTFWDDSSYLTGSLELYDSLTDKGKPGFAATLAHLYGNKAPLICVFPLPIYLLFGRDYDPRCLVGIGFLILMSIYLFRLGTCLWSPREGLLAVAIVQTMPLISGLSRQFLVDYGLAAMVVMWMYYLHRSLSLNLKGTIVRLGILLGLGLLMKITFPFYVAAPAAIAIWGFLRTHRGWSAALNISAAVAGIVFIGCVIASAWYLPNLKTVTAFALSAGFGRLSVDYGSTNVMAWSVVSGYLFKMVNTGVSFYYVALIAVLLPACVSPMWRTLARLNTETVALLLWIMVPLAVVTFAVNKDVRYTAPFLPGIALSLARMITLVFARRRLSPAIVAGLMVIPGLAYAARSFPVMERFGEVKLGSWIIWSPYASYLSTVPGRAGAWGQMEIMRDVCRDAQQIPDHPRLFIPLAHQYLNNGNVAYIASKLKCNLQVIGLPPAFHTSKEVADFVEGIKPVYVVVVPDVPQPSLAPEFANVMKEEAERLVTRPGSDYYLFLRRSAGNTGKEIQIYRRK